MRRLLRAPLPSFVFLAAALAALMPAPGCSSDDETASGAASGASTSTSTSTGSGGAGGGGGSGGCSPGATELCYSGPAGTETTGLCKAGVRTCLADGSGFGPCEGEVTPTEETCATQGDDDCDGQANEEGQDCVCAPGSSAVCYTGPAGTEDTGICHGGTQVCTPEGTGYGPCEGEVTPGPETCMTPDDDDCDGQINEEGAGCVCAPNTTMTCYTGPMNTQDVGDCHGGSTACNSQGTAWGPCVGEVTPLPETCTTVGDDDCDGQLNEEGAGCVCLPNTTMTCYSGPSGTAGTGICTAGTATCNAQGTAWGPCAGEVTPQPENCATPLDEDCDGPDACGNPAWSLRAGDALDQDSADIVADGAGNVYMAGYFQGTIDLGGGPLLSAGGNDIFLVKYSAAGVHLWSKRFGSAGNDIARGLALDPSGNVLMTGSFVLGVDFGGGAVVSAGGSDVFVVKLDAAGNHVWSARFGGASADDEGAGVAADASGNVLLTGTFQGTIDFGGGSLLSAGSNDIFAAKLTSSGSHVWSKSFGDAASQTTRDIAVDATGAPSLIGYFGGTVDLGGGPLTAVGSNDVLLARLSATGAYLWSKRFGGPGSNIGHGLAVDSAGNVIASGYVQAAAIDFGGGVMPGGGGNDAFVAKFTLAGAHVWSKRFGDGGEQLGYGVAVDGGGNVLLTGRLAGSADFGGGSLASAGATDVFAVKLDPGGGHLWSKRFGDAVDQWGRAMAADTSGNVFLAGRFQGSLDLGGGALVSAGGWDVFLGKFTP